MTPKEGEAALYVLKRRAGERSIVRLSAGRVLDVWNVTWGRDLGAEYDHITSNVSSIDDQTGGRLPQSRIEAPSMFETSEIETIEDEWGNVLFQVTPTAYGSRY